MKVKLVQLDGSMMNLALSKLATYHRVKGDRVGFDVTDPDRIYYSAIFSRTADKFRSQTHLGDSEAIFGGYPFNDDKLPPEAEYLMPAYDLWGVDYSLGYTSRGCIRRCPFCIVPSKEGRIKDYQFVGDFHHPDHRRVILLDNNFFASPRWRENLTYINENGLKVNFNQGLDLRIVTDETAGLLAETKSQGRDFTGRHYYFAWDFINDESEIRQGLAYLQQAGIRGEDVTCYVLTQFDSTWTQDRYRCETLWHEYGVHPFVMKFNDRKDDPYQNSLAWWANRPAARRNHSLDDVLAMRGLCDPGSLNTTLPDAQRRG